MKITMEAASYLYAITSAIHNGTLAGPFTTTCPECGEVQGDHYEVDDDLHTVVGLTSDTVALVIGCEGYWLFNVEDGVVTAKPDTSDALGDEVTGVVAFDPVPEGIEVYVEALPDNCPGVPHDNHTDVNQDCPFH